MAATADGGDLWRVHGISCYDMPFESVEMGIYGAFTLPGAPYAPIHPIMQQPLSSKSACRQESVYNVDT